MGNYTKDVVHFAATITQQAVYVVIHQSSIPEKWKNVCSTLLLNYSTLRSSAILRQHPVARFYLIHALSLALLFALKVLRKVMSNIVNALGNTLAPDGIVGNLSAHLPELLSLLFVRGVPETVEVFAGHRIDHFAPYLDADFGVEVKDGFVELVKVDSGEAVVERADVGEATGQAQATAKETLLVIFSR